MDARDKEVSEQKVTIEQAAAGLAGCGCREGA
jgi:hypothetical protein